MRIIDGKIVPATFLARPNRFTVTCRVDSEGEALEAYMPNPGRLWELLVPGSRLLLARSNRGNMPYTVMAVLKGKQPILLHTHLTNKVVEKLLDKRLLPGFEEARVIRKEVSFGRSRFDFFLERQCSPFVMEVKSCTLFRGNISMFPDAVTDRGSRHLEQLVSLTARGTETGILFVVHWPEARYFLPEFHTDLLFARTLLSARHSVLVKAIAIAWNENLTIKNPVRELAIPWNILENHVEDRGCYLIILRLAEDAPLRVGELGVIHFKKGYYLYVGSAQRGLTKRIERHQRKRKNHFWHIDYLRGAATFLKALPIRTNRDIECDLAESLSKIASWSIRHFGSSDCGCPGHLFGMEKNPLHVPSFIDMVYDYRMENLESEIENEGY